MIKRLVGLFIVFSPFTSYFALSSIFRFPILLLLILVAAWILKIIVLKKIVSPKTLFAINDVDITLIILMLVISFSFLLGRSETRAFSHLAAYLFTFVMYFLFLKRLILYEGISKEFVLKMFAVSSFLCATIVILDWTLINLFDLGFRDWFVKVDHKIANMNYYQKGYFISVGGVAEEPGSMALLMNIISPLGLAYWRLTNQNRHFIIFLLMYIVSMIFLASMAGIFAVTVAFMCVSIMDFFRARRKISLRGLLLSIILLVSCISTVIFYRDFVKSQSQEMITKISLSDKDASASIRMYSWNEAIYNWKQAPILGDGPGTGVRLYGGGYHSTYLTLLADTGALSLLLFLTFLFMAYRKLKHISLKYRGYLIVAFISAVIHFSVIGDFYHAPFWILLIVIQLFYNSEVFCEKQTHKYQS